MKQILLFFLATNSFFLSARSIYRPIDPKMPQITTSWVNDDETFQLSNYYLEEYALFTIFDKEFFEKKILPDGQLSYRYETDKKVSTEKLKQLIEELLKELQQHSTEFTHFIVLQSKDFNFKTINGLLILKFKNYPFVVKLFIESPQSFVDPFHKGMEPRFCFFMGGGINRHILGFTRLKNKDIITYRLNNSPWKNTVDLPRKWHYIPSCSRWIEIHGKNIHGEKEHRIQFPGIYCIIADAIEAQRIPSLFDEADKKRALDLCNYLHVWIDPHMKNFMIEKDSGKFIIVDTEHFPSFTGLRNRVSFQSYSEWYLYLAGKCWNNAFMSTKKRRRTPTPYCNEMNLVESYKKLKKEGFLTD